MVQTNAENSQAIFWIWLALASYTGSSQLKGTQTK